MTLGLFVPRSFVSPDGSCGYIPRRRPYSSMAGSGLSRVHRTAVYGGQPLTACPGYAFSPASGGGIPPEPPPFPRMGKGVGFGLTHYIIELEVFKMKRPLAYVTAAWCGSDHENAKLAAQYCRTVYEAGFSPICPTLYQPLFLNDAVPEEHKSGIDMGRDLLRRSHVLVVCGHTVTEAMKNDIAVAQRLGITATTLEGILTVKGQGRR